MDKRRGLSLWIQLSLAVLGAAIGAFLVVWYIRRKQAEVNKSSVLSSPPKYIDLKQAVSAPEPPSFSIPESIQTNELPIVVSALPVKFVRRQAGTIRIETNPGVNCTISAIYSTRRKPQSLQEDPIVTDEKGIGEWRWEIGTGGSHVDIEVQAWKNSLRTTTSIRVDVVD